MSYTLGEAAKATGKSKTTIQRAIKSGKISAKRGENRNYVIDASELHRVFEPVTGNSHASVTLEHPVTPLETPALQHEIELLREQLGRERETVNDLRQRLDKSDEERRRTSEQLTNLLTHDQEEKKPPQGRIGRAWAALKGKL